MTWDSGTRGLPGAPPAGFGPAHGRALDARAHRRTGGGRRRGGLFASGALVSLGIPRESGLRRERELRAHRYLVMAYGRAREVDRARETREQVSSEEAGVFGA